MKQEEIKLIFSGSGMGCAGCIFQPEGVCTKPDHISVCNEITNSGVHWGIYTRRKRHAK